MEHILILFDESKFKFTRNIPPPHQSSPHQYSPIRIPLPSIFHLLQDYPFRWFSFWPSSVPIDLI